MKEIISTEKAPKAVGAYSQAVKIGNLVYTSGSLPIDPKTGKFVPGGIKEQTHQALVNLQEVLKAANTDFSKVIKCMVLLDDIKNFADFNQAYSEFFPKNPPARSAFQAAALPLGSMIEIEMIAEV